MFQRQHVKDEMCNRAEPLTNSKEVEGPNQQNLEGTLREETKENKGCWNIPPLAVAEPAVSCQTTWELTSRLVYTVHYREIQHFALYHGFISNMSCISYLPWCIWVTSLRYQ